MTENNGRKFETELQKAVRLLKLLIKKTQEESILVTLASKLEPEEFVELMSFLYNLDPEWLNELNYMKSDED